MNTVTSIASLLPANAEVSNPSSDIPSPQPDPAAYGRDLWERSVLFLDTLRERADNMIAHERAGMPPLLDFKYENLLDARQFDRPANYALLRITEVDGYCWDDCVDDAKPPVIVVDPRAGHGPGIGGFKRDSEVGMAMAEGHPVYFVIFFPEPAPEQTLEDVLFALRRFVEEVAARHDGAAPVLYGNCQAGWAVALLAAHCEGLAGPVVLNGSPLSYWAGEEGVNPMRVTGGLLGGAWLAHLTADLGDGRFDGAWLAQNFESLKPEKAIWEKYANLFTNVDTERDRFLDFERWWNGFYTLSRPEILSITQNLFIGNQLEGGEMRIGDHCVADLRKIKNPMIIFASYGDNITPPAQALGWIPAAYKDTADLKAAGQRIVYLTNAHVGHLGIFVSASVAKLEHRAILESLGKIEKLKPGLYEMKIEAPTGKTDARDAQYKVRFKPRDVSDLAHEVTEQAFEAVRGVSEINEAFYSTFVSPWVRLMTTPASAEMLKWMHPMRTSRLMFSEKFNPWLGLVRLAAEAVAETREPLAPEDPMIVLERATIAAVGEAIERARIARDATSERTFRTLYGGGTPDMENDARMPV
ncbi:DUF3141 domain-containing protein (plasmid) [Pseudohalocynthiibacter aestuariivivens]|jgi:hypothetical protein|nr:DUF3141 domain-containing protein [Pseudohalocynthiibacter aestuariivivens]QIE47718.1 DUF3141 domain-containing protein [Pseudohalocynthiibacter aestuariivivens]